MTEDPGSRLGRGQKAGNAHILRPAGRHAAHQDLCQCGEPHVAEHADVGRLALHSTRALEVSLGKMPNRVQMRDILRTVGPTGAAAWLGHEDAHHPPRSFVVPKPGVLATLTSSQDHLQFRELLQS